MIAAVHSAVSAYMITTKASGTFHRMGRVICWSIAAPVCRSFRRGVKDAPSAHQTFNQTEGRFFNARAMAMIDVRERWQSERSDEIRENRFGGAERRLAR